jgi:hypothetical protein
MAKQTQEQLEDERDRLVLAASDMRQAASAAAYLTARASEMNGDAERVMWTGLVVTYARPYVQSNRLGAIRGRLANPKDPTLRDLHTNLCKRRSDLFAHNERTDLRGTTDVYAALRIGAGKFVEVYAPPDPSVLPAIHRLALHQEARFQARLAEIEKQLA